jgi:hypothetical protein
MPMYPTPQIQSPYIRAGLIAGAAGMIGGIVALGADGIGLEPYWRSLVGHLAGMLVCTSIGALAVLEWLRSHEPQPHG